MTLEGNAAATFAGHQTFHPRFGWIKKGFDAASEDPEIFSRPDATVRLGVGKNMVDAIRFWCLSFRVLSRQPHPTFPRQSIAVPTRIGEALLGESGLDPYVEDPSTLWVLHWLAVSPVTNLPVWWSAFNDFPAVEFEEADLLRFCLEEAGSTTWSQPNESSVRKDVDCLLRMYSKKEARGRQTLDDLLDSPFRELGLVSPAPAARGAYRFNRGPKANLPALVVLYTALDYVARTQPDANTISVHRLTSEPGSPGRLLRLTETALLEALEESVPVVMSLGLASPAGSTQLVLDAAAENLALAALLAHHETRGRDVHAIPAGAVAGPQSREPIEGAQLLAGGSAA